MPLKELGILGFQCHLIPILYQVEVLFFFFPLPLHEAYKILVPWSGIEPRLSAVKG